MRATIHDIAARAGVSIATVSNVVNGKGRVSDATRQRVLEVAAQLGYRPSRAARNLVRRETRTLGVLFADVCPEPNAPEQPNYYVTGLLGGAEELARTQGYSLLLAGSDGTLASGLPTFLEENYVEGVLLLGAVFEDRFIEAIQELGLQVVLAGTFAPNLSVDAVQADNYRGAHQATTHLIRLGRRRIAFLNGPARSRTSGEKLLGYRDALLSHGLPFDESLVCEGDFSVESGVAQTRALWQARRGAPPDALFVADDPMAIGAVRTFVQLGVRIPEDVAIVGFGDSPSSVVVDPALTTVRVFQRQQGRMATERLLNRIVDRMRTDDDGSVRILVQPELVIRSTA